MLNRSYAGSVSSQLIMTIDPLRIGKTLPGLAWLPDGQKIVYEYQGSGYWYEENPAIDLWIMNRNGSGQALFVQGARAPAWSPADIPGPVVYDHAIFLPLVIKP
jgi:hypothetical protein